MSITTKQKMELIKRKVFLIIRNPLKYLYFLFINAFCEVQYVILDCEFCDNSIEIIQMGLFKLNSEMEMVDSLNIFIKPINQNIIKSKKEKRRNILRQSNESDISFPVALEMINQWLGSNYKTVLCTWGDSDVHAIERNIAMHNIKQNVLKYHSLLDIQQVFTKNRVNKIAYRPKLKRVLHKEKIKISEPLHNAYTDARLTASLFKNIYSRYTVHIAQYLFWQ